MDWMITRLDIVFFLYLVKCIAMCYNYYRINGIYQFERKQSHGEKVKHSAPGFPPDIQGVLYLDAKTAQCKRGIAYRLDVI